ncbi:Ada metal-binding domain-containing protein [Veillonella agrestimuris]|uniref:Ada metal-binding domain-containing protein n=1 Tax=Veillonella agrestimuris TaxID=2941340 RepID=UPI00203F9DD5|nr:Ada metal-binding domain-containing protein [Veillonella agrestimuris]
MLAKKVLLLALMIFSICAQILAYTGNSNTYKFHRESCHHESRIANHHRVHFDTRQEAVNAGYVPCNVCRP